MTSPRTVLELKAGVKVEVLFTPSMYMHARRRGMHIEAEADDPAQVMMAYTQVMYLAAINAHEVRRFDDPALGDFPYSLMDFVEWSSACPDEFRRVLNTALQCIIGKSLAELEKEPAPEEKDVKKN